MSEQRMAEEQSECSQQIVGDEGNGYSESLRCERCKGKGYHHGFGEHGHDPDWCSRCGGAGIDWRDLLTILET